MSTLTFSTLGSHHVKVFDENYDKPITKARRGQTITIELKAALNIDWEKVDKGWVELAFNGDEPFKVAVTETAENTSIFTAKFTIPKRKVKSPLTISYGYWGFEKSANIAF
jgi:hypothetical protein